jgi:hypothetical protein
MIFLQDPSLRPIHASHTAHDFIQPIIVARKDIHAFALFETPLSQHERTLAKGG